MNPQFAMQVRRAAGGGGCVAAGGCGWLPGLSTGWQPCGTPGWRLQILPIVLIAFDPPWPLLLTIPPLADRARPLQRGRAAQSEPSCNLLKMRSSPLLADRPRPLQRSRAAWPGLSAGRGAQGGRQGECFLLEGVSGQPALTIKREVPKVLDEARKAGVKVGGSVEGWVGAVCGLPCLLAW